MKNSMVYQHPIHYTIFKPNSLISADKSELSGMEWKVYNEILNNNHRATPEVRVYKIRYDTININLKKNGARDRARIGKSLQNRSFYLDEEFVAKFFDDGKARSIVPFPEVVYHDDHFEIHLAEKFKKILTIIELGFTKGSIDALRNFKHDVSNSFYWIARQHQSFRQVWRISVTDFREALFIKGHDDWRNFKRRVIEAIHEDMKGTWMEFDIEYIKKGKGGAVKELIFKFRHGPNDEKNAPIGSEFKWEKTLLEIGINERMIGQIRTLVKNQSEGDSASGKKFIWDSHYIEFSMEAAKLQYEKQRKSDRPVINVAAWLFSGFIEGRWIDFVEESRQAVVDASQTNLFEKVSG